MPESGPHCTVEMYQSSRGCGLPAMGVSGGKPVCLLHVARSDKDLEAFTREIEAIVARAAGAESEEAILDFTRVHFPHNFSIRDLGPIRSTSAFQARPLFKAATFHGPTDWWSVGFPEGADFSDATFIGSADFSSAFFEDHGVFTNAQFRSSASFREAKFSRAAKFTSAVFSGDVDFTAAAFASVARFDDVRFGGSVRFVSTVFSEDARYQPRDLIGKEPGAPSVCDLRGALFECPRRVLFKRVNRGDIRPASRRSAEKRDFPGVKMYLVDCDVRGIEFSDVHWQTVRDRLALEDEIEVVARSGRLYDLLRRTENRVLDRPAEPRERGYEGVAVAYRRLMATFDESVQSELAEDCYVGAMEMVRLDRSRPRFQRFVYSAYRRLSNYGSSYRRALVVLLLLFAVFAAGYAMPQAGLTVARPQGVVPVPTIFDAVWHSLEVTAFQRDPIHVPSTAFGRLLDLLQSAVMPAQLALVLLAFRRRLRR